MAKGVKAKKPAAYTQDEAAEKFLELVWVQIRYWQEHPNPRIDRIEGVAFSILALLDGSNASFPKCNVVLCPHKDDKAYLILRGERYYKRGMSLGELHSIFHSKRPKQGGGNT